ncbi:MAG: ABC transporter ATP-binding protein [Oscillospiraceae bacterium]|nr:ABC transporter ATP-binding protein [Oscillospiraceae bacterium]
MQKEILKVSGVNKSYGEELIFRDVNFEIREGEVVGFLGNNGTGKTTMMKIILGLTPYSSGQVQYLGDPDYLRKAESLNSIGFLMETPLYGYLDAHDTLKLMSYYSGQSITDAQIDELLKKVRLKASKKKVKEYSFGMCQKLRLAIAFMYNRKLLILDEPTVGLDPQAVDEFVDIIKEMVAEKDVSVLLSSHQLEAIEPLCDRYLYISDHQIKEKAVIDRSIYRRISNE